MATGTCAVCVLLLGGFRRVAVGARRSLDDFEFRCLHPGSGPKYVYPGSVHVPEAPGCFRNPAIRPPIGHHAGGFHTHGEESVPVDCDSARLLRFRALRVSSTEIPHARVNP